MKYRTFFHYGIITLLYLVRTNTQIMLAVRYCTLLGQIYKDNLQASNTIAFRYRSNETKTDFFSPQPRSSYMVKMMNGYALIIEKFHPKSKTRKWKYYDEDLLFFLSMGVFPEIKGNLNKVICRGILKTNLFPLV